MKTRIARVALFVGGNFLILAAVVTVLTFGDASVFRVDPNVSRLGAIVSLGLGGLLFAISVSWLDKHYRPVAQAEKALRTNVTEPFEKLKPLLISVDPPPTNEVMAHVRSIATYAYDHEYPSQRKFVDFANNPGRLRTAEGRAEFSFLVYDLTLRRREAIDSKHRELYNQ